MDTIKVIVADDQTLMRDGLKTMLSLEDDMEVVCTVGNGKEAFEKAEQLLPDIVLMDVRMPVMDGIESLGLIKRHFPQVKVIMLTTFEDEEYIIKSLASGADGFLLKDLPERQLVEAVRNGARGELILQAKVGGKLASRLVNLLPIELLEKTMMEKTPSKIQLSSREKDVAALMIRGMGNRKIAEFLRLSEGTVKNYISVIYEKIGTNDRSLAITFLAERFNLIN